MPASPHDYSYVQSLFWGRHWDKLSVYDPTQPAVYRVQLYFPRTSDDVFPVGTTPEPVQGFDPFFSLYEDQAKLVATEVSSVAAIEFTYAGTRDPNPPQPDPDLPQIYFYGETLGSSTTGQAGAAIGYVGPGYDYQVSATIDEVSIRLATDDGNDSIDFAYQTIAHEFLHALGLKHPFAPLDSQGEQPPFGTQDTTNESTLYTQLAYVKPRMWVDVNGDGETGMPEPNHGWHLGVFDVAALQTLYGANYATNNTDTVYGFAPRAGSRWAHDVLINGVVSSFSGLYGFTVWDGGGEDTYDFSQLDHQVVADLRPGYFTDFLNGTLLGLPGNMANAFLFQGNTASLIENVKGTDSCDWISGNQAVNRLYGNGGNDEIFGWENDDFLYGGNHDDVLDGGEGDDLLDGGAGWNTASYASASAGVLAELGASGYNTGEAAGDTYINIQNAIGSRFGDVLYGTAGVNRLEGGAGNDLMAGKASGDTFDGGSGSDTVSFDASGAVTASLKNRNLNQGDASGDTYISIENLTGGSFDDTLYGNEAANRLKGNHYPNLNVIDNDRLFGLGGNDKLFGYKGNDRLTGGLGADRLEGGAGTDRFIFSTFADSRASTGRDRIIDFSRTQGDGIWLNDIDANSRVAGNQAFKFIGAVAFSGIAGQLRFERVGTDTHILGDINGDKVTDLAIISDKVTAFVRADFVL